MKLEYFAIKDDNVPFRIVNSKLLKDECDKLPKGRYRLTISTYRKNKSNPQLGYYFACVLPMFLSAAIDMGWEITTVEECDIWLKSMFANKNLINKISGEVISVPALKREMTTSDMLVFTNEVRDYAAEYLNVHIPDPETNLNINFDEKYYEKD